jgi:hypothetical protein
MTLSHFACTAVILLGIAQTAAAQAVEPTGTGGNTASTPGVVATIDVSRLPVDLQRIRQRFRENTVREERNGLNLRYFVDVFAKAPNLVLLTKEDNLVWGQVPNSTPTHADMIEAMTPREYRNHGGANILRDPAKK